MMAVIGRIVLLIVGIMMNPFEKEFWDSLNLFVELNGGFSHRFTDTSSMRFMKGFSLNQPADFMSMYRGVGSLFECKSVKNKVSFECRYLKEHQLDSLLLWEQCGGRSWILFNERSTPRNFNAYAIRAVEYASLCLSTDRKSLRWDDIAKHGYILERVYPKQWNLSQIMA